MIEVSERIGTDLFLLALIENTIDYCKTYVEEYDEDEVVEYAIKHTSYYVPCDMDEMAYEICSDLGYKIEY